MRPVPNDARRWSYFYCKKNEPNCAQPMGREADEKVMRKQSKEAKKINDTYARAHVVLRRNDSHTQGRNTFINLENRKANIVFAALIRNAFLIVPSCIEQSAPIETHNCRTKFGESMEDVRAKGIRVGVREKKKTSYWTCAAHIVT